jgi:mannose-6-phosphate isomerase-like protein (cupin superfamily)
MSEPQVHDLHDLATRQDIEGSRYLEFLRVPEISAGIYTLPAGAEDPQEPHAQDELYHVIQGRAVLRIGSADHQVTPGSVCFVPALMPHRFHSIAADLRVLVVFAPCEDA